MSEYDSDVLAWSKRQGALLRRIAGGERVNDTDLDCPNIIDEVESVHRPGDASRHPCASAWTCPACMRTRCGLCRRRSTADRRCPAACPVTLDELLAEE
jgi:hypothetical protein